MEQMHSHAHKSNANTSQVFRKAALNFLLMEWIALYCELFSMIKNAKRLMLSLLAHPPIDSSHSSHV